ncbi:hypothetical protein [Streptomyces chartreusis]|nr:hypothetical protein [Streptomyces chartreusis]
MASRWVSWATCVYTQMSSDSAVRVNEQYWLCRSTGQPVRVVKA